MGEYSSDTLPQPDYFLDNQWASNSANQVVVLGRNSVIEISLDQDGLFDTVEALAEGYARKDNMTKNVKAGITQVMP